MTIRRPDLLLGLAVLTSILSCRMSAPARFEFTLPERVPQTTRESAPVSILSAHLALDHADALAGRDGITVVFSEEVDAASLDPRFFLVLFVDGSRVRPAHAVLSPASESDENRTVTLVGDFGDPLHMPPGDVMVVGPLYAETGAMLRGLVAPISVFATADRPVLAVAQSPSETSCPGHGGVVRTYWTDALRGVEEADLASVRIEFSDSASAAPVGFDDQQLPGEIGDDNVLDLCVATAAGVVQAVAFGEGAFTDVAGHPTAEARIEVSALPATAVEKAPAAQ